MASRLVVDASAILAVVLREPGAGRARPIIESAVASGMLVPDHFWLELVDVLVRRYGMPPDAVVAILRELDDVGVETVAIDRPTLLLALDHMARFGLTAYDAAYLALAEAEDASLLTLDEQLALAAGPRSALRPASGTREGPAPYTAGSAPPDWARHGRHLADLRRIATGS
jgi:predicted nucleic acid-binding protein